MPSKTKNPPIWIGDVGIRDGQIIDRIAERPICDRDLPLHGLHKVDAQLTSYGRLENWEDKAGRVFRKVVHIAASGKTTAEWVPMHGRKDKHVRRAKIAESAKRGETMFDPSKYVER